MKKALLGKYQPSRSEGCPDSSGLADRQEKYLELD
jgi:hypothetical protein